MSWHGDIILCLHAKLSQTTNNMLPKTKRQHCMSYALHSSANWVLVSPNTSWSKLLNVTFWTLDGKDESENPSLEPAHANARIAAIWHNKKYVSWNSICISGLGSVAYYWHLIWTFDGMLHPFFVFLHLSCLRNTVNQDHFIWIFIVCVWRCGTTFSLWFLWYNSSSYTSSISFLLQFLCQPVSYLFISICIFMH